jgi:hypothetical protein
MSESVTKQSSMRIIFPNRKRHGLFASLFPKDYGQFLLVRFTGYLIATIVVAFGFFIVTALLNDRNDKAVPLILLAAAVIAAFTAIYFLGSKMQL